MGNLGSVKLKPFTVFSHPKHKGKQWIGLGLGCLLGLSLLFFGVSRAFLEALWFQEVGYESVFWTQHITQIALWAMVSSLSIAFMGSNFAWAYRLSQARVTRQTNSYPESSLWRIYRKLAQLILSLIGVALSLSFTLIHYSQEGIKLWFATPSIKAPSLGQLSWASLPHIIHLFSNYPSLSLGIGAGLILLLLAPMITLSLITFALGLELGFVAAHQWATVLAAFNVSAFDDQDPLFHLDIGFYVFQLPLWELIQFILIGVGLVTFLGVTFYYLISGHSLRHGRLPTLTPKMQRHLYALTSGLMVAIALSWGLHCFTLLYDSEGTLYGAGFTDRHVHLPVRIALGFGALIIAGVCGVRAIAWQQIPQIIRLQNLLGGYLAIAFILEVFSPFIVQTIVVIPNELTREKPYIEASIRATRHAFGLDTIQTEIFDPSGTLTSQSLKNNVLTIRNIRLWDSTPLLMANRQLQRIRPYYEFADADIDRYLLSDRTPASHTGNGKKEKRQVLISARELDFRDVPKAAQTWVNRRLIYTHGYGFTVSPVNSVAPSGLPEYFVQDINVNAADNGQAATQDLKIGRSIPTQNPRIYFGEMTNHYILSNTKVQELDYPSGEENALNRYDGSGGITVGRVGRRLIFATALKDWQMMLSPNVTPQTRVLIHRFIRERVHIIAPFLRFDQDPYLVAAAVKNQQSNQVENSLYWIMDAYTLSDRYPYSDPGPAPFNYIRNSIKVVVDAYNGSVQFYSVEPDEPILKTWQKIFPTLIQPLEAMPEELQAHLRYPIDLFQAQSQALLAYHMTDPQVFYNREDQWRFPIEIYGNEPSQVKPYYLITKLPDGDAEEFVLLSPFTPAARNNMIGWMAARSDGDNYGKRLLYKFPKRELVLGPEQVEALINQDPAISQQITLWNRQGSKVLQGNLLIIPIERSLLYVEPLYIEAEKTAVPTLVRVIVLYKDRIAMAESLNAALNELFNIKEEKNTIVRNIP